MRKPKPKCKTHATPVPLTGKTLCNRPANALHIDNGAPSCTRCLLRIGRIISGLSRMPSC